MNIDTSPVVMEFPLRGKWQAPTTPAKTIPSHGTNRFGQRYAYDFLQLKNKTFYNTSFLRFFLFGVPLKKCYSWGKAIYAPCDGEIVTIKNARFERKIVHWFSDSLIAFKNAYFFNHQKDTFSTIGGNYIILKYTDDVYAVFAHLQKDSINVALNQKVKKGDFLGKVGHSGNSTAPHLHFQLMNSKDIATAQGIPCLFEQYEVFQDGQWIKVYNAIPTAKDCIRFSK